MAFALLGGCGDGSGGGGAGGSVSSQPLAGTINGKPWTFVAGQTDAFLSKSSDTYFADLYDQALDTACGSPPSGANRQLILNIPKTVGHYTLSLNLNQTFSYNDDKGDAQNDIAVSGQLDVTSITATKIQGGVNMAQGSGNSVNGQFEITICDQ